MLWLFFGPPASEGIDARKQLKRETSSHGTATGNDSLDRLEKLLSSDPTAESLAKIRSQLATIPPSEALEMIRSFLRSGRDQKTDMDLAVTMQSG
jgi:hypothetical protein